MPATSASDKLFRVKPRWTTTIGSGGVADGSVTTIPLSSVSGLNNGEAYVVTINRVDSNGNRQDTWETVIGTVSGSNLVNCARGVEGTASAWNAGTVVEILMTAEHWNRMVGWAEVEHDQDGTHKSGITLTSPKIGTAILDTNGNEIIETPATSSAVNQVKIINAATGDNPAIEAAGDDTAIPLLLKGKSASPRVSGTYDNGNLTGSVTINCKNGTRQKGTLTGNVTITLSNPQEGEALELFLFQDATGGRTISFSTSITWQDNTTPSWTTTANKLNSMVLRYIGSTWYGVGAKFA